MTIKSLFSDVPIAPPDAILGVNAAFRADSSPKKISLGVGAYRTSQGKPYVLPVVRKVEQQIASDPTTDHEYLPQHGLNKFNTLSARLILGSNSLAIQQGRCVTVQALSGTGALRIGFTFVSKFINPKTKVYVPNPTWSNHKNVVPASGLPSTLQYRYFDSKTGGVDEIGLIEDLSNAPHHSIILLHGCAHNPTGADPSKQLWRRILAVCQERQLIPFFDNAYQGFASGSLDEDAWSVRLFVDAGMEAFISQSYAKNMGLYGHRTGAFSIILKDSTYADAVQSQLKSIIRAMYSSPPLHGARIAAAILDDEMLFKEWEDELKNMSGRIKDMRIKLKAALEKNGTPGTWDHIVNQIGMFSFTGLTKQHVSFMREKYHIYMTDNGRISMAGLTDDTIQYVADAMKDALVSIVKQD